MKFSISSKHLQHAIAAVSKVILKKNALALYNFAMVSKNEDTFYLTGASSDNELTVKLELIQTDDAPFLPFAIDPDRTLRMLSTIPEQPLEIVVDDTTFKAFMRYEGGNFSFVAENAKEFPLLPQINEDKTAFTIPVNVFVPAMKAAQLCTANAELRQVFQAVCLDTGLEGVIIVGTDGKALYKYAYTPGLPFLSAGEPAQILVPRAVISAIEAVAGKEEAIAIRYDGQRIEIKAGDARLVVRAIEGKYPNYSMVIPKESAYHLCTSLSDLSVAVKRVQVSASEATLCVILSKNDGVVSLSADDLDFARSASTVLLCSECILPDGFRIGFGGDILAKLLNNIASDEVRISLNDKSKPILLSEVADNSQLIEMCMPQVIAD